MIFKRTFIYLFLLAGVVLTTACSKDDNNSSGGMDLGYMNVSVTGDFTAEKSGMADFDLDTYSSTTIFDISGH